MDNPQKSVNRESHYARFVRGANHPLIDLNNPELVVSREGKIALVWVRKGLSGLSFYYAEVTGKRYLLQ